LAGARRSAACSGDAAYDARVDLNPDDCVDEETGPGDHGQRLGLVLAGEGGAPGGGPSLRAPAPRPAGGGGGGGGPAPGLTCSGTVASATDLVLFDCSASSGSPMGVQVKIGQTSADIYLIKFDVVFNPAVVQFDPPAIEGDFLNQAASVRLMVAGTGHRAIPVASSRKSPSTRRADRTGPRPGLNTRRT